MDILGFQPIFRRYDNHINITVIGQDRYCIITLRGRVEKNFRILDFWVEIVGNPNEVRKRITSRTHLAELNLYD